MYRFKLRRDTSGHWFAENPILADGEPGFEKDTGRLKIGNGFTPWNELDYFIPSDGASGATLSEHVSSETPHPVYDSGPSLSLLYENAKV